MDISTNLPPSGTPGQGVTDLGTTATTQTQGASQATTTPEVVSEPVDQMTQAPPSNAPPASVYIAPSQTPALPKPVEQEPPTPIVLPQPATQAKSTAKGTTPEENPVKSAHDTAASQQMQTLEKQGEQPVHTEKQPPSHGEGDQQGEGGSGGHDSGSGGGSGSDSSGGGSQGGFSGGSGGFSGQGFGGQDFGGGSSDGQLGSAFLAGSESLTLNADGTVSQTANVNAPPADQVSSTGITSTQDAGDVQDTLDISGATSSQLASPPTNLIQVVQNFSSVSSELATLSQNIVNSMPDSPDKFRMMDFLKDVGEALIKFQQVLGTLTSADAAMANKRSKAQLQVSLDQLARQKTKMDKMFADQAAAQAKQRVLGILMKVFAIFFVLGVTVLAPLIIPFLIFDGPAGWAALPLLVSSYVDSCAKAVDKKPFMMALMAQMVDQMCGGMTEVADNATGPYTDAQKQTAKAVAKMVMMAMMSAIMIAACPCFYVLGGSTMMIDFFNQTHVFRDTAIAAGANAQQAQQAELYSGVAMGVVAAAAAIGASLVCAPAIGEIGASMLKTLSDSVKSAVQAVLDAIEQLVQTVGKGAQKFAETIKAILKYLLDPQMWADVSQAGLQVTEGVMSYKMYKLQGDIAMLEASIETDQELTQAAIKVLKKVIQDLLNSMQGMGQEMINVSKIFSHMYSDASSVISNLFNAGS